MTISTILTDLQGIHENITGVKTAPVKYPNALTSAILPCVLLRPSNGSVTAASRTLNTTTRTYSGVCFVATANAGAGVWEKLSTTYDLMQAFQDEYESIIANPTYRLEDEGENAMIVAYRDSGQLENLLQFGDGLYEGFEFTVEVELVN